VFERVRHQRIGHVLEALDAAILRAHRCWFGGGTAIALKYGEYRESVDIDFLVSDLAGYRGLRHLLTGVQGIAALARNGPPWEQPRETRADQYGIRALLVVQEFKIKFEIVLERRMALAMPADTDRICGIATLTTLDLLASKLLANSDRWGDGGVFSRDVIDLAMMQPKLPVLRQAVAKAQQAYGDAVLRDLGKAIDHMKTSEGWLEHCMQALAISVPRAVVWQRLRALERILPS